MVWNQEDRQDVSELLLGQNQCDGCSRKSVGSYILWGLDKTNGVN